MKYLAAPLFLLLPLAALAQHGGDSLRGDDFGGRMYSPDIDCRGCPMVRPGGRYPDNHPNAGYLNDTTLWEWREVDMGKPFGKQKVYDLKPQYVDTIRTYDGEVVEVPVWVKYPGWKKPVPPPIP